MFVGNGKVTYICSIQKEIKTEKMRYLHYITTETETLETQYSNSKSPKMSMEALAQIEKANYSIQDRKTNEIICLTENGVAV